MGKTRAVTKYVLLSGVTALYSAAAYRVLTEPEPKKPVAPRRVATAAGVLAGLTWICAIL
jgi:hypothetical protein